MGQNDRSDRSNREKWSTSKGGPTFPNLFRLDRTDPFSFRPKLPEILVEWIAPNIFLSEKGCGIHWPFKLTSDLVLLVHNIVIT